MKNRIVLAQHFKDLGFTYGAEIGVLGGTYSIDLCEANPKLKLYCIDSWGIGDQRKKEYHERKYEEAQVRLKPYRARLIRKLSLDAVKDFDDQSLDFVYIDANHNFDHVMRDIIEWSLKVKKGGIVSGHDYIESSRSGIIEAVDVYVKCHKYKLHVTSESTKGSKSWYFTKE